jgi:hypothetical protein
MAPGCRTVSRSELWCNPLSGGADTKWGVTVRKPAVYISRRGSSHPVLPARRGDVAGLRAARAVRCLLPAPWLVVVVETRAGLGPPGSWPSHHIKYVKRHKFGVLNIGKKSN